MTRRILSAVIFGALIGFLSSVLGLASSPIQACLVGLLSALGFVFAALLIRSRLRQRQSPPTLAEGETALLYGPGEVKDGQGTANAWIYLSNRRLILKENGGVESSIRLDEIEELRPPAKSLFAGAELGLVVKGRGLIILKVPDGPRWQKTIQEALRKQT